ncbi:DUF3718 domain-containing protein [Paraglaciecola psychrophila]|uniref:Uncharacterized protein n=1 Tax=Paraglaciecola psychrophila 170 TaxID=1129794 RepID=K7A8N2_9ALTE|nr:DUF3718 domain-containing protein [Paraglaciecola psychrophila]AGH46360.1 hypothetical protein C427_4255 [Paraglaciecola psychrophila 170]GAC37128.1 hypothetical protein GPSY_1495 [Paraglaciecola psychrophila 170]
MAGNAQANYIDKGTEAHLVKICEAIKNNNTLKVHRAIKNSGIRARIISEGLVCNGYDPVTFAIVNKAQSTAKFMARKSGVDYEALLARL